MISNKENATRRSRWRDELARADKISSSSQKATRTVSDLHRRWESLQEELDRSSIHSCPGKDGFEDSSSWQFFSVETISCEG